MLSYEKRAVQWKKRTIVILSLFLLIAVGVLTYLMRQNAASEPTVAQHPAAFWTISGGKVWTFPR